ncbi:MAG: DUF167 domain-containing protein [Campylobacterota bacterium]|nr:DUF167 domain-containing protein [Campylobacterota bacterium]
MYYNVEKGTVRLKIKAQPNASRSEFAGLYDGEAVKIRIKAPAVEGAANKELIRFLSKSFKVAKSEIKFKTGQNSKIKTIEFPLSEKFKAFVIDMKCK